MNNDDFMSEGNESMKQTLRAVAFAAVAAFAGTAKSAEPGVYASSGDIRFILTSRHALAVEAEGKLHDLGSWKNEVVAGKRYLVFRTWRKSGFSPLMEPQIWAMEEVDGCLRPLGRSFNSVADAVASAAIHSRPDRPVPEFAPVKGALLSTLERSVDGQAAAMLRERKAYLDKVEIGSLEVRLKANPDEILGIEPAYPKLDPEEDAPGPDGMGALYPDKMQAIIFVLSDSSVVFKEDTLLRFLDKLDWDRGDLLAFLVLRREEVSAKSRRRLAPRVFARFGKSDDRVVSTFFADENTPIDVLEAAKRSGGYGEYTAKAIGKRLEKLRKEK